MRSRWKARTEEGLEDETERMTEAEKPSKRKRRRAGRGEVGWGGTVRASFAHFSPQESGTSTVGGPGPAQSALCTARGAPWGLLPSLTNGTRRSDNAESSHDENTTSL